MRKLSSVVLSGVLALSMVACSSQGNGAGSATPNASTAVDAVAETTSVANESSEAPVESESTDEAVSPVAKLSSEEKSAYYPEHIEEILGIDSFINRSMTIRTEEDGAVVNMQMNCVRGEDGKPTLNYMGMQVNTNKFETLQDGKDAYLHTVLQVGDKVEDSWYHCPDGLSEDMQGGEESFTAVFNKENCESVKYLETKEENGVIYDLVEVVERMPVEEMMDFGDSDEQMEEEVEIDEDTALVEDTTDETAAGFEDSAVAEDTTVAEDATLAEDSNAEIGEEASNEEYTLNTVVYYINVKTGKCDIIETEEDNEKVRGYYGDPIDIKEIIASAQNVEEVDSEQMGEKYFTAFFAIIFGTMGEEMGFSVDEEGTDESLEGATIMEDEGVVAETADAIDSTEEVAETETAEETEVQADR